MNKYQKLASNTLIFAIGSFGTKFLSFILIRLYTGCMTTDGYSDADLLYQTVNVLYPILTLSMADAVIRFGMDKGYNQRQVYTVAVTSTLIGLGAFAFLSPVFNLIDMYKDYGFLLYVFCYFSCFRQIASNFVRAKGYVKLFAADGILSTLVTVICNLIFLLGFDMDVTGYVLSIKRLPGRNALLLFVLFTMLFNGGLIPNYLTISSYNLIDNFWVLVLPGAVSGYSIVLMKNYIAQIPASMKEAAEIDGASPTYIMCVIIIPLSVPIIATLSLFCAIGKWNDWTTAFFYIKQEKWLLPFQNVLQSLVVNTDTTNTNNIDLSNLGEAFKNALIVVSIIPVTIAYLCAQKYFIKGLFIGSVKE